MGFSILTTSPGLALTLYFLLDALLYHDMQMMHRKECLDRWRIYSGTEKSDTVITLLLSVMAAIPVAYLPRGLGLYWNGSSLR